jgi:hypothetical protein
MITILVLTLVLTCLLGGAMAYIAASQDID